MIAESIIVVDIFLKICMRAMFLIYFLLSRWGNGCAARSEFVALGGASLCDERVGAGAPTKERGAKYKPRGRGLGQRNSDWYMLPFMLVFAL